MDQISLVNYYTNILNQNTDGIVFVGGYLIQTAGGDYTYQQVTNYYTSTEVEYVPVTFSFIGEPKRVPNYDITEWNMYVTMEFYGNYDTEENLTKQVNAVDTFRLEVENNPLGTVDSYKITSSVSPITKEEHNARGNKKQITVSFELSALTGVSIWFGNSITSELALKDGTLTEVFSLATSIVNGATEQTEPDLSTASGLSKSVNEDNTVQFNMSFLFDNSSLVNELIKSITGLDGDINKKYDLKLTFPSFPLAKVVVVTGGTISMNPNDLMIVNVQFKETI